MNSRGAVYQQAPRRAGGCMCGCLAALGVMIAMLVISALVFLPRLPGMAAQAIGFQEVGAADTVFVNVTPLPTPVIVNLQPAGPVTFTLGDLGGGTLDGSQGVAMMLGSDAASGSAAGVVSLSEADLLALCQRYADICMSDPRFQNVRVDLRPGGAVIYADVTLPELANLQQNVGVVAQVDSTGRALRVAGLEIAGMLYAIPSNDIGQQIHNAETQLNQALQQFVAQTSAGTMTLDQIFVDDSTVTLSMR